MNPHGNMNMLVDPPTLTSMKTHKYTQFYISEGKTDVATEMAYF